MPTITESADEWLARRRLERDERRRERLHGLWLLASGAAGNRLALASQFDRNPATISAWLDLYAAGGLTAPLAPAKPTGLPNQGGITLPPAVRASISERLVEPEGARGYRALWPWARAELSYSHFHRWMCRGLGARLKVVRKSHGQKKRPSPWPASSAA